MWQALEQPGWRAVSFDVGVLGRFPHILNLPTRRPLLSIGFALFLGGFPLLAWNENNYIRVRAWQSMDPKRG